MRLDEYGCSDDGPYGFLPKDAGTAEVNAGTRTSGQNLFNKPKYQGEMSPEVVVPIEESPETPNSHR